MNCDEYTTGKGWIEGEEGFHDLASCGIKDSDSWAAAESCTCDDICNAIVVEVARNNFDRAAKSGEWNCGACFCSGNRIIKSNGARTARGSWRWRTYR